MGDEAKKENSYGYTAGLGLVGALAGAALTKLLEDEDKKATLKDYLIGSGLGLGVGALSGRLIDTADPSDVKDPQNETLKKDKEDREKAVDDDKKKAEAYDKEHWRPGWSAYKYKNNEKALVPGLGLAVIHHVYRAVDRDRAIREAINAKPTGTVTVNRGLESRLIHPFSKTEVIPHKGWKYVPSKTAKRLGWLSAVVNGINIADALSKATGRRWLAPWYWVKEHWTE